MKSNRTKPNRYYYTEHQPAKQKKGRKVKSSDKIAGVEIETNALGKELLKKGKVRKKRS